MAVMNLSFESFKEMVLSLDFKKTADLIKITDENGYNLLHSATFYNSLKIATFLIQHLED